MLMAPLSYSAKAPGTLMLCGEHAVLQHKRAIVFAVDKWIKVTLKVRSDSRIFIDSRLGRIELELGTLQIQEPFKFVIAAILYFKKQLSSGFELTIDSEFDKEIGLGSSAAVTVAVVAVLGKWVVGTKESDKDFHLVLFETTTAIIRAVQGRGSGADVAACVYGSIIQYQSEPPYILKRFPPLLPFIVIYSGYKTPTPTVIEKVETLSKQYPEIFKALYEAIDATVVAAAMHLENQNWIKLGELLTIQQGLMNALKVGSPLLNQIVDRLNQEPYIWGAKISGAGLGDCVLGLGNKPDGQPFSFPGTQAYEIPLSVSSLGMGYE